MRLLGVFQTVLALAICASANRDSALVSFYKFAYTADTPDGPTFYEAFAPGGLFITNGINTDYDTTAVISKRFISAYHNIKILYSGIVEVPKRNGTDGEGSVGAHIHWQGDLNIGGHDEFHSHNLMIIEKIDGKQQVVQTFEVTDYQDKHHLIF